MPYTLNIDHPNAGPGVDNYGTDSLKPTVRSIISMDNNGAVLSYFFHDTWDLTPYSSRIRRLHFKLKLERRGSVLSGANKATWKRVIFWTLYGLRTPVAAGSIAKMFEAFRYVVKVCSEAGVRIDQLSRFPRIYRRLSSVPASIWPTLRTLLHRLYNDRDLLGFEVLGPEQLSEIGRKIPARVHEQTAYIPERIYFYILERCERVVDAYLKNQNAMERLYRICSYAYSKARIEFGPKKLIGALKERVVDGRCVRIGALDMYAGGSFRQLAEKFGVLGEIESLTESKRTLGTQQFGTYLTTVALAARILVAAFSAARDEEHAGFRRDCLETRDDEVIGRIFLLSGATKKTKKDKRAYWITSSVSEKAVKAAASVAALRACEAASNPKYKGLLSTKIKPLFPRVTDPWIGRTDVLQSLSAAGLTVRAMSTLSVVLRVSKKLLDEKELVIQKEDLEQALRLDPDLNPERFAVGKRWPLAWHQFRRTFVCLAAGAGVSIASTAWQLKHVGPWMALHYRRNYFDLHVDPDLADEFARAQVEILLIRGQELADSDFVPLSRRDKSIAVRLLTGIEERALRQAAEEGRFALRETGPGLCTNPDPCPYGGWEDVAKCVGCAFGYAQRSKRPLVKRMQALIEADLEECQPGEELVAESLAVQLHAIKEILDVTA
ncbi:MAG TPA: hypothetical protein VMR06_01125 [Dokdonella sp.]|uniref:hypothetical protein n=1 Tax=Dokdonella sp. TaxID=2291710 RepID=UPI002C830018|nr:hypothetical protein [Dokdonella sp.]HUD40580.1 hypothetical protein [Dokdonella sp.]